MKGGIKLVYPEVNITKIVVHNNEKNEVIISASDDLQKSLFCNTERSDLSF